MLYVRPDLDKISTDEHKALEEYMQKIDEDEKQQAAHISWWQHNNSYYISQWI
jgi:hypothetical protein